MISIEIGRVGESYIINNTSTTDFLNKKNKFESFLIPYTHTHTHTNLDELRPKHEQQNFRNLAEYIGKYLYALL